MGPTPVRHRPRDVLPNHRSRLKQPPGSARGLTRSAPFCRASSQGKACANYGVAGGRGQADGPDSLALVPRWWNRLGAARVVLKATRREVIDYTDGQMEEKIKESMLYRHCGWDTRIGHCLR